jgi:hypothetical protein
MSESNQAEQFEQSMHDLDMQPSNHEQPQTQTTTQHSAEQKSRQILTNQSNLLSVVCLFIMMFGMI